MSMLVNSFRFGGALSFVPPVSLGLTNPGAELGDASGWTATAGDALWTSANTTGAGYPAAIYAGSRYFTGGSGIANARMYQDVDVSAYATDIDAGLVRTALTLRFLTYEPFNDDLTIFIRALDVSNTLISSVNLQDHVSHDLTNWISAELGMQLPSGTRKLRVEIWASRKLGVSNDVHVDAITLTLHDSTYNIPPRYDTLISFGDRTGIITVSAISLTTGGGTLSGLIDGTSGNNYYWTNATGDGNASLKFDFGSGASWIIDEFIWKQDNSATHGTWRLEGSNDDSTWTQIGSDFTLRPGLNRPGNPSNAAYRYCRLRHMSGSRSGSPWLREIMFRAKV